MGKKSRRQKIAVKNSSNSNGDKNKRTSNKWTTSSEEKLTDCVNRIFEKFDSVGVMNLETALALESEVASEISKQKPRGGYRVNPHVHVKLANYFRAVDNPDACNKAVSHYRKVIDQEVKLVGDYEADIIRCYLDFDRCDEAMEAFKAFSCSHVENDTAIDPEFIMSIARRFESKGGFVHKLRLQKLLSSFDLTVRSEALGEYRIAIDGYKSSLSISRDQNDKSAEAHALKALGRVYAKIHKNHTAMNRLQKALAIRMQSKTKVSISQMIDIYIQMGYVHLNHGSGGMEQNALEVFETALQSYRLALVPTDEKSPVTAKDAARLVSIYNGMGLTYYILGQWDRAIQVLNKSVEYVKHPKHVRYPCTMQTHYFLGCTYLQKYRTLPFDLGPEEPAQLLQNAWEHMKLIISIKKYGGDFEWTSLGKKDEEYMGVTMSIIMCLQGRRDEAKPCLQMYFDTEASRIKKDDDALYCHCCHQSHGESIKLKKCAGCKVNYYCNKTHQKKEWRGRFIGHRMLCPFLKRWRRVKRQMKKGRRSRDSFELILNHFFYMIEREYSKDNSSGLREID
jgi:tetratricopeptide (TPR) repeat protein